MFFHRTSSPRTDIAPVTSEWHDNQSEGFPERDIWFLGTLDQGSARCPELLGRRRRRRRHLILPGGAAAPPDPPLSRPAGLQDSLAGLIEWLPGWLSSLLV